MREEKDVKATSKRLRFSRKPSLFATHGKA